MRRVLGGWVVVALVLVLTSCTSAEAPEALVETDAAVSNDPQLSRYYEQNLDWEGCGNGIECADLLDGIEFGIGRHMHLPVE